ncbi:MAG: orotate phosphoribosyltransferase [Candidatus Peribacteraceae bacterium]|nr:orotate phosphoribosyltransferase [Candidatus Peribacteraceae bacterium]
MPHGDRIAEYLLAIQAVRLATDPPFTWTSGIKAPIYCDNRMIYSHPDARDFVVAALANRVKNLHIEADVIAGTATAAIGWGALVADRLKLPFVYVRSKAKEHGAKKMIEGDLKPGKHVVVIEDLISTMKSSANTVQALREEGKCIVTDVVAIFSYELAAAAEKAREINIRLHPLTTLNALLKIAEEREDITGEQAEMIGQFSADPENWGKKHNL